MPIASKGPVSCASEWRQLGRLALESLGTGLFVSLVLALAVFIISVEANAATAGDPGQGTLLLRDDTGERAAAPLLSTDVHMDVTGIVARVQVTQRFANPTAQWREGVYVFPLPDKAAVDHLTMRVGERVIEGQIKERTEARRTYENAKAEGRKTTLLEQERPNMFTTSVANIGPGEEIVVALEYEETLRYGDGAFHLRFPLAITPRYIPGAATEAKAMGIGWSQATAEVPDADRITPPFVPARDGYVNPVSITIDMNAGFPLANVASSYHAIDVEERPGNRYRIVLSDGPVPAARDFELVWTPDVGSAPGAALFTETLGGKTYALLMTLPPTLADADTPRAPREITYIVDTSGSMEGVSIAQARDALSMALDRLQAGDRFNVIEFNSTSTSLFTAPMPFDAATHAQAKRFVARLRARGGTEMLPALAAALDGPPESSLDAAGRFPHRRRSRQRGCDPAPAARQAGRPAPVHDRNRSVAQHVLPDQGGAVRPRHVHVHRRRARGAPEDDRPVPQAGESGADGHHGRMARRHGRVAAAGARSLCRRTRRRHRPIPGRHFAGQRRSSPDRVPARSGRPCCRCRMARRRQASPCCGRARRSTR